MGATKKYILKGLKCIYFYFTTGYSTHIVGKWHLGFFSWPYTPLHRGFDSFYGMYHGCGDHYKHKRSGILDLHDNKSPVKNKDGVYSMNLFAEVWNNTRFLFIYSSFCLFHLPFEEDKCNSFYRKKSSGNKTATARKTGGIVRVD